VDAAAPILFDGVSKKFRRGTRHTSLRDLIPALAKRLIRGRLRDDQLDAAEFWAVRDISFAVQSGEALGIVGPNGAGKSTILKLLNRIMRPNLGKARVLGRSGALIEVAAGFHPDLTGRENVFLQGAIMGMRRAEITRKFDQIVDFAGVTDFIDTPVKRYSSGMNARLGFSIAAHLDPDVLLIDEVLAVGDMAFQERCYERMLEFKRNGVAIAFVSHNLKAVAALCDRVLVLRRGQMHTLAPTEEALQSYAMMLQGAAGSAGEIGTGETGVQVLDQAGRPVTEVTAGQSFRVRVAGRAPRPEPALVCVLRVRRVDTGDVIFETTSMSLGVEPIPVPQGGPFQFTWDLDANLARGHYSLDVLLRNRSRSRDGLLTRINPAAIFMVNERQSEAALVYLNARCRAGAAEPAAVPATRA
jgi:lipopolysaccharide transport system ATP-binding protein